MFDELEILDLIRNRDNWDDVTYREMSFDQADFSNIGGDISFLDFSSLDLENCNFSSCRIENCSFDRSNLYGANFDGAVLLNCTFRGSTLTNSNVSGAELENCDFAGTEMSRLSSIDTTFIDSDISRARGLSQSILDSAVGGMDTQIPQFLDYPDHWLLTEEDREIISLKRKLSSSDGDSVILCIFDGMHYSSSGLSGSGGSDVKEALSYIQRQISYAIEDNLFHNECPQLHRAIFDYYCSVTGDAGRDRNGNARPRWPKKIHELNEITVALDGNNLGATIIAQDEMMKSEFSDKFSSLSGIIQAHTLLISALPRWRSFLQGANEVMISEDEAQLIKEVGANVSASLEENHDVVDLEIPHTIKAIINLMHVPDDPVRKPNHLIKVAGYGVVKCIESIFIATFSFCKQLIGKSKDEIINLASKNIARTVVAGLMASGAYQVFSIFPHLKTWLDGALHVLKGLGFL